MGYGLPAAVGVQLCPSQLAGHRYRRRSVGADDHAGNVDGGAVRAADQDFHHHNQYMGMVRQWQELLHGGRYAHSYTEALPDFVKLAEAYHAVGIRCERPGDVDGAIREMIGVNSR